jgi:hypothetical protein
VADATLVTEPSAPLPQRDIMLLDFLRDNDADCPNCNYNLRALTTPVCPECNQPLVLTVGIKQLRLGWLFASVAPGFFSGIAACFLLIPIIARIIFGDGQWSITLNVVDGFGFASGLLAIFIATNRNRFLAQSRSRQRNVALIIWFVHVAALAMLLVIGPMYI